MLGPRVGLKLGPRPALAIGVGADQLSAGAATVAVDQDATSGIYVPSSAAQFTALGLPTPAHLHLCQEASGSLADTLGSMTLAANAAPAYQQTTSGWSRNSFKGRAMRSSKSTLW